jgi:hypothetical protein
VPGRLPPRAIPAVLLQQDWALGLIGLKFAHHLAAGMPDGRLHLFGRPFQETFQRLLWTPLQARIPSMMTASPCTTTNSPSAPLLHTRTEWVHCKRVCGKRGCLMSCEAAAMPLQVVGALLAAPYVVTRGVLPHVGLSVDTLHVRHSPALCSAAC